MAQTCDNVAIMYAGEIVEYGSVRDIFKKSSHPYTKGLFGSIPNLLENVKRLKPVKGEIPDPTNLPEGCRFCTRCEHVHERCYKNRPQDISLGDMHKVRCFLYDGGQE